MQPFLNKEASLSRAIKTESLASIRAAALLYAENLPKLGTTRDTLPRNPSSARSSGSVFGSNWMMNLHPSHRLWTAGGLAFCSECGAVSQGGSKTRLSQACGTKKGKISTRPRLIGPNPKACKMPAGSIWRTRQLLAGKLRGVGKSVWPNGTNGKTIIVPSRIFPQPVGRTGGLSSGSDVVFPMSNPLPIDIGRAVSPSQHDV